MRWKHFRPNHSKAMSGASREKGAMSFEVPVHEDDGVRWANLRFSIHPWTRKAHTLKSATAYPWNPSGQAETNMKFIASTWRYRIRFALRDSRI